MNYKERVIEKFKKFKNKDIIITHHAELQSIFRNISLDEIRDNIINPKRLVFAGKQEAEREDEEKYDCYFAYSNIQCQRYVVVITSRCIICTVIKVNRRWQRMVEKYSRKRR